jgi:hypothetical protein
MQWEIADLRTQIRQLDPAAAVKQLEKDLFAKMQGEQNLKRGAEAAQDAQRRAAIDEGLKHLPTGNFRSPAYWGGKEPDVRDLSHTRE